MSNYSNAIGIDVSRDKFDVYDYKLSTHRVYTNEPSGFKQMLKEARKDHGLKLEGIIFVWNIPAYIHWDYQCF